MALLWRWCTGRHSNTRQVRRFLLRSALHKEQFEVANVAPPEPSTRRTPCCWWCDSYDHDADQSSSKAGMYRFFVGVLASSSFRRYPKNLYATRSSSMMLGETEYPAIDRSLYRISDSEGCTPLSSMDQSSPGVHRRGTLRRGGGKQRRRWRRRWFVRWGLEWLRKDRIQNKYIPSEPVWYTSSVQPEDQIMCSFVWRY